MRAKARYERQGKRMVDVALPHMHRAAHYAADKSIRDAKLASRSKIRSVGLGRLANAIGSTSSLEKKRTAGGAWGAIYARGGIDSRANQALMAYTEGATILPTGGRKWLAFPTKAAGRLVRLPIPRIGGKGFANFKNQPSRMGGVKLRFVQFSPRSAALVLDDASVSKKTGRAKSFGKRLGRGAERKRAIVMFRLIKVTTRAARFNQHAIVAQAGRKIPFYAEEFQRRFPIR